MITLNQQPAEGRDYHDDGSLEIVGEPWYTIQGEGPFAGRPAVFVRTAGCNLFCAWCDTDYTTDRKREDYFHLSCEMDAQVPSSQRYLEPHRRPVMVVTGGEPFRQNITRLVENLLHVGYQVQIETNGTICPDEFPFASPNLTIVCSPKTPTINTKLQRWIKAYKYVLDADNVADDGLPLHTLGNGFGVARPHHGFRGEVFVQPAEPPPVDSDSMSHPQYQQRCEQLDRNIKACVESCMKFGYRYSCQLHKVLGLK